MEKHLSRQVEDLKNTLLGIDFNMPIFCDLTGTDIEKVLDKKKLLYQGVADCILGLAKYGDNRSVFTDEEGDFENICSNKIKIKPIKEQLLIWKTIFPKFFHSDLNETLKSCEGLQSEMPEQSEGCFIIPLYNEVAKNCSYTEACKMILGILSNQYSQNNILDVWSDKINLRRVGRVSVSGISELTGVQTGLRKDAFVALPAQLGTRHLRRSARRAEALRLDSEFSLGMWDFVCMLITHIDVVKTAHVNWFMCAGDRCEDHIPGLLFYYDEEKNEIEFHLKFSHENEARPQVTTPTGFKPLSYDKFVEDLYNEY